MFEAKKPSAHATALDRVEQISSIVAQFVAPERTGTLCAFFRTIAGSYSGSESLPEYKEVEQDNDSEDIFM